MSDSTQCAATLDWRDEKCSIKFFSAEYVEKKKEIAERSNVLVVCVCLFVFFPLHLPVQSVPGRDGGGGRGGGAGGSGTQVVPAGQRGGGS